MAAVCPPLAFPYVSSPPAALTVALPLLLSFKKSDAVRLTEWITEGPLGFFETDK